MSYKKQFSKRYFHPEYISDLKALIERAADMYGDKIAYEQILSKRENRTLSFAELKKRSFGLSTKLISMGLQGKHLAIIGENSIDWVIAYFAAVNCGCVVIPLDRELNVDTLAYQINFSDAEAVFATYKAYKKISCIRDRCKKLDICFIMGGKDDICLDDENCVSFDAAVAEGVAMVEAGDSSATEYVVDREKLSEIIFTSGTTGANKGVMLNHRIACTNLYNTMCCIDKFNTSLSVLPINHTYEKNMHIMCGLYCGARVCFNNDLKYVAKNMKSVSPDVMVVVPLFVENIAKKIKSEAEKTKQMGKLKLGIKISNMLRRFGIDRRREMFSSVLSALGGELHTMICGGAPLTSATGRFMDSIGVEVIEGYGITECGPLVAANSTKFHITGSVGMVMPTMQLRIAYPDKDGIGEIEVKGDNVMMGYYKDDESTNVVFTEDGWFKTGDTGRMKDNILYITGRVKDLIILPNGKNVSPEELEGKLMEQIPYLQEVVVYSDDANTGIYAACYLDREYVQQNNITDSYGYLMKDIRKYNTKVASFKRISNAIVYDMEFEKTTTRKIQRFKIPKRTVAE